MIRRGYRISNALIESMPFDDIDALVNQGAVDLGWWTRGYDGSEPHGIDRARLLEEYADGFYRVTEDLLDQFVQKSVYSDSEALAILFLFCQFAELALKAAIESKIVLLEFAGKFVPQVDLNEHNLSKLLQILVSLFEPNELGLSKETQDFIDQISDINEMSQAFRYPFDLKKSKVFLADRLLISMGIFRAEFKIHGTELRGFCGWLVDSLVNDGPQDV
jgi:hypothetical protein